MPRVELLEVGEGHAGFLGAAALLAAAQAGIGSRAEVDEAVHTQARVLLLEDKKRR